VNDTREQEQRNAYAYQTQGRSFPVSKLGYAAIALPQNKQKGQQASDSPVQSDLQKGVMGAARSTMSAELITSCP
jgi:hypothetical protein